MLKTISSDDVTIAYQIQGEGKPALVFIHGWGIDRSYWKAQLTFFAKKHNVVAIDLAGHGESGQDRKEWTMGAFGEDVAAVVKELEIDPVILIGHSMAGFVILETARRIPDRTKGLIGVDTLIDFEIQYPEEQVNDWIDAFRVNFVHATTDYVRTLFPKNADPALVEKTVSDTSSTPPKIGVGILEGFFNYQKKELIRAVQEVKVPLVCINSDMHPTNIETNRRYMSSFKLKLIKGVGHFPMVEDPETFNRLLQEAVQEFI
jgi:pimeloyl-ACP methyl ester carboxylesterase